MASLRKTPKHGFITDDSEGSSDELNEPKTKISKPCESDESINDSIPIKANADLLDSKFIELFRKHWTEDQSFDNNCYNTVLHNNPFKLCTVQNLLADNRVIKKLINEMLEVEWTRKVMDLYEYYQSKDLSTIHSPLLSAFFKMLCTDLMPWMEQICNITLKSVSASCSMYTCGDYLLVHDDLLSDRQIAFVFYLSPWENAESWRDEMGGCLELFSADSNGLPQFPVVNKISPKNNQFVFFKVSSRSFHQVGEVTNFDYPRLTINGWFHGDNNTISTSKFTVPKIFTSPDTKHFELSDWIRRSYLEENIKHEIQSVIEDRSEIRLDQFFLRSVYEGVTNELIADESLQWILKGPANSNCYETLDLTSAQGLCKDFFGLFTSKKMFKLLQEYTDLDLYGPNSKSALCCLEVQRWKHGSYTILGDDPSSEENLLDVILYLNPSEHVGQITYLALDVMEDDETDTESNSALLTVYPRYNALNIVYSAEGSSRFIKYVSKKVEISKEFVYIVFCSYKE